jgi:hypothetical protein
MNGEKAAREIRQVRSMKWSFASVYGRSLCVLRVCRLLIFNTNKITEKKGPVSKNLDRQEAGILRADERQEVQALSDQHKSEAHQHQGTPVLDNVRYHGAHTAHFLQTFVLCLVTYCLHFYHCTF